MKNNSMKRLSARSKAAGLTLIELMIALLLGLLVLGAAIGIFVSNRQAYTATESLSRVQENSRVAFELMAREVREAGGNPCAANIPTVSLLNPVTPSPWWMDWSNGVRGYDGTTPLPAVAIGTAAGARVDGTDAIELRGTSASDATVTDHNPSSAQFKVSTNDHGLQDKDIVLVCDYKQAAIFQITQAQPGTNNTVVHNEGNSTPGNCTKYLGYSSPANCGNGPNAKDTEYAYGPNSIIARVRATAWYVGHNGRGSRSLYQVSIQNTAGTTGTTRQEITEGVRDMQLEYLMPGAASYVPASSATITWPAVSAVRIVLTMEGADRVGTDGNVLTREVAHVVALRNRNS